MRRASSRCAAINPLVRRAVTGGVFLQCADTTAMTCAQDSDTETDIIIKANVRPLPSDPSKPCSRRRSQWGSGPFGASAGHVVCESDRRRDCVVGWPSVSRTFEDLARPRCSCTSCSLRRTRYEFVVAVGRARCCFRNGGRLRLVFRQTAVRARAQLHDARSRSGPRIAVSCVRLQRLLAAWSSRRCLDRACVLRRRAGGVAALLRRRPAGSSLLRDAAHKLVQCDLRPIVKANRNDGGPRPH